MIKFSRCFFLFLLSFLGVNEALAQVFHLHQEDEWKSHLNNKYVLSATPPMGSFRILKTDLKVKLDPEIRFISGEVRYSINFTANAPSEISLDLSDSLVVDTFYSFPKINQLRIQNNKLFIATTALSAGSNFSFVIRYHGIPPVSAGFGAFQLTKHDSVVPLLATLSQPYGARDWWPCFQTLGYKSDTTSVHITVPHRWYMRFPLVATSNGKLTGIDTVGNELTFNYLHTYPMAPYLLAVAVTNYKVSVDTLRLNSGPLVNVTHSFPEDADFYFNRLSYLDSMFMLFEKLFGPYPYAREQHGHTQWTWGGGMEHQSNSFMHDMSFALVSHELGHQWFGDKITCGSWQDIWLNEGFASYLTALCYENLQSGYWYPIWKKGEVTRVSALDNGSVFCSDTSDVSRMFNSRLTYSKASLILHMLRWEIGDTAFFQGIKSYIQDPQLSYSFSLTNSFIQHMEAACGRSLKGFFDDWLYGEGTPVYQVQYNQRGNQLNLDLFQTQTHPSVSFFEQKVQFRVYGYNTSDSLDFVENISSNGQTIQKNLPFEVSRVVFDPEYRIVARHSFQAVTASEPLIFPVPAFDYFNLEYSLGGGEKGTLTLYDARGRLVRNVMLDGSTNWKRIEVQDLQPGTYSVKIVLGTKSYQRKIIIK